VSISGGNSPIKCATSLPSRPQWQPAIFQKITVDVKGDFELKNTINTMVDQLNSFASEVTRVAREVEPKASLRPGKVEASGT
jgi:hypothetical protein